MLSRQRETGSYADLTEIYVSAQGEGIYLGERQTFVRFAHCNLSCRYCDTVIEPKEGRCKIETTPGTEIFNEHANPLHLDYVISAVKSLTAPGGTISLTGGEPLLQAEFLQSLLPEIRRMGYSIYLETNGTLWNALKGLLPYLNVVAMDMKLPSATGGPELSEEHAEFLRIAVQDLPARRLHPQCAWTSPPVFVKIVVTDDIRQDELLRYAELIASINMDIPLVIQPVTAPARSNIYPPSQRKLLSLQEACGSILRDVRIIPQCHHLAGLR